MSDFIRAGTRRWMLRSATGAALAAAVVAAETIAKPDQASAANGDNVVLGTGNTATSETTITNSAAEDTAFQAVATGSGTAIVGQSGSGGLGVGGYADTGVGGFTGSGFGVLGSAGLNPTTIFRTKVGVTGSSDTGIGVQGCSDSNWGVYAISSTNTGLQAGSTSGDAVVATSVSGSGVYAQSGSTDGFAVTRDAVRGFTDATTAAGVRGENAGGGAGVSGAATSAVYPGVEGSNGGTGPGVYGTGGIGVLGAGGTGVSGSSHSGVGVVGASHSHWGVSALSDTSTALQAQSKGGVGVVGVGTATGMYGQSGSTNGFAQTRDGVRGFTDSSAAAGVRGENAGGGPGLSGAGQTGVLAEAKGTGATALDVQGPAVFSRSGLLTIAAGASAVTKANVPLTGASLVLATLQQNQSGLYVTAAVPNIAAGSFTVHLNKAAPKAAKVAWFIVN